MTDTDVAMLRRGDRVTDMPARWYDLDDEGRPKESE